MKRRHSGFRLAPLLVTLPAIGLLHHSLFVERQQLGLTRGRELEAAPPALAFTTVAFGAFRGLLANGLWSRAVQLQDRGDYFELVSLADWITQLQPDNGLVWAMQAWNLTYNLSVQFDQPADRWRWVQSGISLLRDQGLRYNPHSVDLYRELAWLYQDKIGSNTDVAHRAFKAALANEMGTALGPDYRPGFLPELKSNPRHATATQLANRHLDLDRMARVDEQYGPFDWRLPEPHAVYWAAMGLEQCRDASDIIRLRRVIWQCVERSFQRGRIARIDGSNDLEYGPNLDLVPNAWRVYEEMKRQEPGREDYIGRGQNTFIREAICLLYAHQRVPEANHWFEVASKTFPGFVEPGLGLEEFVVSQVSRQAGDGKLNRVLALLEGLLGRHYRYLALGDDDAANGHALLVRRIWEAYQARQAGFLEPLSLPSLPQLQARVLEQIRAGQHGFTPELQQALSLGETRPGIEPSGPTNTTDIPPNLR